LIVASQVIVALPWRGGDLAAAVEGCCCLRALCMAGRGARAGWPRQERM